MNKATPSAARIAAFILSLSPVIGFAGGNVLTGTFDGSERVLEHQPNPYDCNGGPTGFQELPFQVSHAGDYIVNDVYDYHYYYFHGSDAGYVLGIYPESLEPAISPHPVEQDQYGRYNLQSGRTYSLRVHSKCPGFEGAWAAVVDGPGEVVSSAIAELPSFLRGTFTPDSPTMTSDCGAGYYHWGWGPVPDKPYHQVGPVQLRRGGDYYHGPIWSGAACLAIYSAPVDPANRQANRVALLSGWDAWVTLEADVDYWFVSIGSGWEESPPSFAEYLHVLVPTTRFRINSGMNGAWYNPATPGEGYFISVFDTLKRVFVANFTHSDSTVPGDPYGHRWYTAAGTINGSVAELDLELTSGGAFNASEPAPQQVQIGRLKLQFDGCERAFIESDTGASDDPQTAADTIPLHRLGGDWDQICQSQFEEGLEEVGPL